MERSEVVLSREKVARRAFERFVSRGFSHGRALEDWLEAESELRSEVIARTTSPTPLEVAAPATIATEPAPAARPTKKRRRK